MEENFPAVGELVIGNCTKLTPHGAYFEIFDYEKLGQEAGFVHISELSSTWIKNIRSHIREGQRAVAKILRIDEVRGEIDMSIRRVSEPQRRQKMTEFKQENRARGIIAVACEKVNVEPESIEKILLTKFRTIYDGLIQVRDENVDYLIKIGIPEAAANEIHELAVKELEPPMVSLYGVLKATCYESDGSVTIANFFKSLNNEFNKKHHGSKLTVQIISPPAYRFLIESEDWKTAENIWKNIQSDAENYFRPFNSILSFERK